MNKSKQAQEFEQLLAQNEEAFVLQNQTLAEELAKLQNNVKTLENDNRQLKRQLSLAFQDKTKEAEFRKLQASNSALKQSLESLRHRPKVETHDESESSSTSTQVDAESAQKDSSASINEGAIGENSMNGDLTNEKKEAKTKARADSGDDSKYYTDLEVNLLTLQEEKRLLEFELDSATKKYETKVNELSEAMKELQQKLDQKQKSYTKLQKEFTDLQAFKREATTSGEAMKSEIHILKNDLSTATSDCESLHKALQDSHAVMEQQQSSLLQWQNQITLKEEDYNTLKSNHAVTIEKLEIATKEWQRNLSKLESLQIERDEAHMRSEKTSTAGEALLDNFNQMEKKYERLEHELRQALNLAEERRVKLDGIKELEMTIKGLRKELEQSNELAEKRKQTADEKSIEAQEMISKLNSKMESQLLASEEQQKSSRENYESKLQHLEHSNKIQEEELIRLHHQERLKTRELDSLQQKINDLLAANSSLENSKGWFERALKDAEKATGELKCSHIETVENLKLEHNTEIEKARLAVEEKEQDVAAAEDRVLEVKDEVKKSENEIERLKRDVKDEVHKQKLVEKKVRSTLKDLKKQLAVERKKNEVLQEKIKEQSSGNSNLDELLTVVNNSNQSKPSSGGADGTSSVSSFSFRDLIGSGTTTARNGTGSDWQLSPGRQRVSASSPIPPSAPLAPDEAASLLSRITDLQNENWALQEKVGHLEESTGAMADELIDKTMLVQQYVQHTRTDSVKRPGGEDHLTPRSLKDKVKSFVTGNEEPAGIGNIYELNKKLTRMLEEEMTKNLSLKKDMELMAKQLSSS